MAYILEEEQVKNEPKQVDVYPLKKGKRTLLYLCDLIIVFFFSFVFYAAAVVPLSGVISKEADKLEVEKDARSNRNNILFKNKLLYQKDESSDLHLEMSFTFEQYSRYL